MGSPNSIRATRRYYGALFKEARASYAAQKAREARERKGRECKVALHDPWETIPTGVLIYHLRTLRPQKPLTRAFHIEPRNYDGRRNPFYWDSDNGLVLYCEGQACACIGFEIDDDIVVVRQIQGRRTDAKFFLPFPWEKLLLDAVTYTAYVLGFRRVEVLPADENKWLHESVDKRRERFVRRYDETAEALGFSRKKNHQNFRLVLR